MHLMGVQATLCPLFLLDLLSSTHPRTFLSSTLALALRHQEENGSGGRCSRGHAPVPGALTRLIGATFCQRRGNSCTSGVEALVLTSHLVSGSCPSPTFTAIKSRSEKWNKLSQIPTTGSWRCALFCTCRKWRS